MNISLIVTAIVATAGGVSATFIADSQLPRYLTEKTVLLQELEAWKQSQAGQYAQQHGFITTAKIGATSDEQVLEDQLRRLFLTKLHIQEVQRVNPDAVFSTDSPFTLMTNEEFAAYVGRSRMDQSASVFHGVPSTVADAVSPRNDTVREQDVDWTTSGCVAAIKDQGQCGSCWAFASVAALESAYCIKGHELTTFSDQQVASCDSESHGCEGGFPSTGLQYVKKLGKICRDSDYPYTSGQSGETGECKNDCNGVDVAIQQVASVPESESGLLAAVRKTPVAVGVAAGNDAWKQYKSGIVATCASDQLDHAVVVVGFGGSGSATPFLKIKNSWGTSWGEDGFIRLKRGVAGAGTCGVVGPKSVYPVL